MSALTLTANAKPVFLSENYFNRHADNETDLVVTTGDALKHRLYDMDRTAQWVSTGSNDLTQETIVAGMWLPGMQTTRSVDFIAILNHNLKNFAVEVSENDGSSWTTVYSATVSTDTDTIISLSSPVDANKIRISMNTAQTTDANKLVGAVVVALATFQAEDRPVKYDRLPARIGHKTAKMADNSIRRAYKFRSDNSFKFEAFELEFIVDDESAEHLRFRDLAYDGVPFLFMPRPGNLTNLVLQCEIRPNTYSEPYLTLSTSAGILVKMIIEEIGGA